METGEKYRNATTEPWDVIKTSYDEIGVASIEKYFDYETNDVDNDAEEIDDQVRSNVNTFYKPDG